MPEDADQDLGEVFHRTGRRASLDATRSLGCLTYEHPLRRFCIRTVRSGYFHGAAILFTLWNCINIVLGLYVVDREQHNYDTSTYPGLINAVDIILIVFFCSEAAIKIIAGGLINAGKASYFRSFWNIVDFICIILS